MHQTTCRFQNVHGESFVEPKPATHIYETGKTVHHHWCLQIALIICKHTKHLQHLCCFAVDDCDSETKVHYLIVPRLWRRKVGLRIKRLPQILAALSFLCGSLFPVPDYRCDNVHAYN